MILTILVPLSLNLIACLPGYFYIHYNGFMITTDLFLVLENVVYLNMDTTSFKSSMYIFTMLTQQGILFAFYKVVLIIKKIFFNTSF